MLCFAELRKSKSLSESRGVWVFAEEEAQEQVRRMAAQAAKVDSARVQVRGSWQGNHE